MHTPPFEHIAFSEGVRFEGLWDRVWTNRIHRAGTIRFPSGKVIVADALATQLSGHPGFERQVPDVEAEVFVAVAESQTEEGNDDWMTLAAWVRFSDADIVHWEPAWPAGYEPDDNYVPGFGVDTGTACIADADAAEKVDFREAGERLLEALNATGGTRDEYCFHPSDRDHFFAVQSGLGDGFYSSFWGLDAHAEPVVLAVDFNLMRRPNWHVARIPLPLKRGRLRHEVFELAGAQVRVSRLPLIGTPKLHVRGGVPRVRVLEGERVVAHPSRTFHGVDPVYDLGKLDGTHLEIAFSRGHEPVVPLDSQEASDDLGSY